MSLSERQRREKLGRRAENLAALYLRLKGYRILSRRFKCKAGEIDIIARKKNLIIFIEVKARKSLAEARGSISASSKNRISHAANIFLAQAKNLQGLGVRFDAVFVLPRFNVVHEKSFW